MSADPAGRILLNVEDHLANGNGGNGVPRLEQASFPVLQAALRRLRRTPLCANAFLHLFRGLQRFGVSVLPNHYYWPVPDMGRLHNRRWTPRSPAFQMDVDLQMQFASELTHRFASELDFPCCPPTDPAKYHRNNGFFEAVDAEMAYCMVRQYKPRRVVEVGGGHSTRLLAQALSQNQRDCTFISIEPYPDKTLQGGIPGLTRLLAQPVQEVPLELFSTLEAGDILFVDSSHVVCVGGDVVYEFFEIFPRLRPGVLIHMHDIFYPSDYPRDAVLKLLWFWSEQYLLEALLTGNAGFEVLWGSSAAQLCRPDHLEQVIPAWRNSYANMPAETRRYLPTADGRRVWPSSFWMRKKSGSGIRGIG